MASPFLTVAPIPDRHNRTIILLHSDALPEATPSLPPLPPGPLAVVYLHAAHAETPTSLLSVRAFRLAYEACPLDIRSRIAQILAVHISFPTHLHIYINSFSLQCQEYSKLIYCDLLTDLEHHLGLDSTLLGLRPHDFSYDDRMRTWLGRKPPPPPLDPYKPLLDISSVSLERDTPQTSETPRPPRPSEP